MLGLFTMRGGPDVGSFRLLFYVRSVLSFNRGDSRLRTSIQHVLALRLRRCLLYAVRCLLFAFSCSLFRFLMLAVLFLLFAVCCSLRVCLAILYRAS